MSDTHDPYSIEELDQSMVIGIVFNAIFSFVAGLMVLNWTITFYLLTKMHVPTLLIRKPKSVLLFGTLCSFGMIFRHPINTFLYSGIGTFEGAAVLMHFLLHCTTLAIVYVLVHRAYLVYFDINFAIALQDEKWRHHIDTSEKYTNWFIKNRQKYGNSKTVALILLFLWSIFTIIGTISVAMKSETGKLISMGSTGVVALTLLSIIAYKIPKFEDIWKVRKETKQLSVLCILMTIGWFSLRIILKPKPYEMGTNILSFFHICLLLVPTSYTFLWVFRQFKLPIWFWTAKNKYENEIQLAIYSNGEYQSSQKNENSTTKTQSKTKSASSKSINILIRAKSGNKDNKKSKELRLSDVFENNDLFNLFARQLLHEFAIENILFFVETHQFIELLSNFVDNNNVQAEKEQKLNSIKFSMDVPKSTIITNLQNKIEKMKVQNILKEIYNASIVLFLKYVTADSDFSINVSFGVRNSLYQQFGYIRVYHNSDITIEEQMMQQMTSNKLSINNIIEIFDSSRQEVFTLMRHSFFRFKTTPLYKSRLK